MCVQVTTTNQETGEVGKEPLMTLGKYRCAAPTTYVETCLQCDAPNDTSIAQSWPEKQGNLHGW